jgi:hypothetical protein
MVEGSSGTKARVVFAVDRKSRVDALGDGCPGGEPA